MSQFPCPTCGAILDANLAQPPTQTRRNSDANAEIAHDSKSSNSSPKKIYNEGYDQQFLSRFWSVYPLRRDKRKAQSAWRKAVLRLTQIGGAKADAISQIEAGAIRYRDDPNRVAEFTKWAEGWLNGDGWEDEPLPFRLRPAEMNGRRSESRESPRPYDGLSADVELRRAMERMNLD